MLLNEQKKLHARSGQAIIEYILMVIMLAMTVAIILRNSNRTIYQFWTGLTRQIASPCVDCRTATPPQL